ncbi:hypothetical protein SAMN05880590_11197 [Rhizobium sp. RU35A]|uniref:hypothetical protein n=1 Tax=Rhizobium sp. RU35A TaxID=1907414 RepID=UPI0009548CF9|nr:hypothetical protein [Rhizobium sp. RU35A]SIR06698.1 hypothetical protein SAMN05880590_11197 [Rhizobium sp. RU35A]
MTKVEKFPDIPDAAETLSLLHGSSVVQAARAEKVKRIAEARKLAVEMRDRVDAIREKEFPEMDAALAKKFVAVQSAEKALHDAKVAYGEAFRRNMVRKNELDFAFNEHNRHLLETCDPSIDLFISEMRDALYDAHRMVRIGPEVIERHPVTGRTNRRWETNAPSVNARVSAIREAMDAAERMKLEADQSKVPERLQKIRNELPAVKS